MHKKLLAYVHLKLISHCKWQLLIWKWKDLQLVNPKIISQSNETITDLEGSITLPDVYGEVTRSKMIVVESYDVNGNKVELTAHEDVADDFAYYRSNERYPFYRTCGPYFNR